MEDPVKAIHEGGFHTDFPLRFLVDVLFGGTPVLSVLKDGCFIFASGIVSRVSARIPRLPAWLFGQQHRLSSLGLQAQLFGADSSASRWLLGHFRANPSVLLPRFVVLFAVDSYRGLHWAPDPG